MAWKWLFSRRPKLLLLILLIATVFASSSAAPLSESDALIRLKTSLINATALVSWIPGTPPCQGKLGWDGLICSNDAVVGLRLENMGLSGDIDVDALLGLPGLRGVSFATNSFTGKIPDINRITHLKAVYLNDNQFSGEIPSDFFSKMMALKKIWLSNNKFSGEIPPSLGEVPNLVELRLDNNQFSGKIPNLKIEKLTNFDVSNNNLSGEISPGLSKFPASDFAGNPNLCGQNIAKKCTAPPVAAQKPTLTAEGLPNNISSDAAIPGMDGSNFEKSTIGIIALGVILFLIGVMIVIKTKEKDDDSSDEEEDEDFETAGNQEPFEVQVSLPTTRLQPQAQESGRTKAAAGPTSRSRPSNVGQGGGGNKNVGEFVMMNEDKGVFGLPDLMKAAAEILGSGGLGSSYKAVIAGGKALVVKRIREMNAMGKDGFEAEIRMLGKIRHPNVLTPLAFHYRKDEKLLIYEFVSTGSLLFLLHGDRKTASHQALIWPSRLRIIKGIARGLSHIHSELGGTNLPHGNLKSSNVLIGPDHEPRVSEYGFSSLINSTVITKALIAHRSPEALSNGAVSPKSDVFCLGILILEIMTGKVPSQYSPSGSAGADLVQLVDSAQGREPELLDPEIAGTSGSVGQMVRMIRVATLCANSVPEQRLDLREATKKIDEIQIEDSEQKSHHHRHKSSVGDDKEKKKKVRASRSNLSTDNQFQFTEPGS
ncbi:Pollen receptor-like kinase 3 [Linum perenne]